jgi:prepilin-type N-terminal cleavage/methylation domain-containing protein
LFEQEDFMHAQESEHIRESAGSPAAGFSLVELMIAMTITLVLIGLASALLASSFNIRGRENQKSSALADAQRALNGMTREIANSGFGLSNNGIVATESSSSSIRVRANLNAFERESSSNSVTDSDEDVLYNLFTDSSQSYVERIDINSGARTTILANRVDALVIRYYADKVDYTPGACTINTTATEVTDKSQAKYIVIVACVQLPAFGVPRSPGYQPATSVQLISDVSLRNSDLVHY